jgi:hypothetical protein
LLHKNISRIFQEQSVMDELEQKIVELEDKVKAREAEIKRVDI